MKTRGQSALQKVRRQLGSVAAVEDAQTVPAVQDAPIEAGDAVTEEAGSGGAVESPAVHIYGGTLGRMLVEAGLLSPEAMEKVVLSARHERLSLGRILVRDGLILSRSLAIFLATHLGLEMIDLRNQSIDREAVKSLPETMARRYHVLPIGHRDGRLVLATSDPTDLRMVQDVTARSGMPIESVIATSEDIFEHIDIAYRMRERASEEAGGAAVAPRSRITAGTVRETPPIQVIDLILTQAIQDRASDIHIEPAETRLRVRFRIDGILHDILTLPLEIHPALISRLKIMSGMNIAERRRPQDGQFGFEGQGRKIDVRAAISGTVTGEMAVLRILDKEFTLIGLEQLGMTENVMDRFRRLLHLPYGMIIVCGPTGAGKSTTLYASVLQMDRVEQKVVSLEDPVEYRIADVNQMQINAEAGITFAGQLRSTLRLDPDVIMLGEIRDQETAIIATQASLTGHLVLTSLHANDSVSALIRLRDLGVAPYLVASSVAGIISQRMVRVVCNSCQVVAVRPLAEQEAYVQETGDARDRFLAGSGCNVCAQTGYRGRIGVYEMMTMTDGMRQLFLADAPRHELLTQALDEGLVPLRREGMTKVTAGITTPYEVMRVLFSLE